jgi:multiple sugar transport system substrate-binding protein
MPSHINMATISRRNFLKGLLAASGGYLMSPYVPNKALLELEEQIELQFWHQWGGPPNSTALEEIGRKFNQLYPNVTISLRNITDQSQIALAIDSGASPDIVHFVLSDAVPEYAQRGELIELGPLLEKDIPDWKDRLYWYGPEVGSYDGKVYALASANFNFMLLWNSEIFKEVGLDPDKGPETLEQLVEWADKMTVVDKDGTIRRMGFVPNYPGIGNGQPVLLIMYGWAFGGEWYDPETKKIRANHPKNIEALKWEASLYQKLDPQKVADFVAGAGAYLTEQDLLRSGKVGMMYDGIWNIVFPTADFPFNVNNIRAGGFPAPASNPEMFGVSIADSDPNCLPYGCPHPDIAWEFMRFMCFDPAIAAGFAQVVANPCQLLVHPDYPSMKDKRFQWSIEQQNLKSQRVFPRIPVAHTYTVKLGEAEQAVLMGHATAEDALNQVTQEIQDLLDSMS